MIFRVGELRTLNEIVTAGDSGFNGEIVLTLTAPSGHEDIVRRQLAVAPNDSGPVTLQVTPHEVGTYSYTVKLVDTSGRVSDQHGGTLEISSADTPGGAGSAAPILLLGLTVGAVAAIAAAKRD